MPMHIPCRSSEAQAQNMGDTYAHSVVQIRTAQVAPQQSPCIPIVFNRPATSDRLAKEGIRRQ